MKMDNYVIGIDVGGTRLKAGAVTPEGKLIRTEVMSSGSQEGPDKLCETIIEFINATTRRTHEEELLGIGLSLSGGVDPEKGVVLLPGKFKSLEGYPLVPRLKKEFNIPVMANNDGRLAAYSERYFGLAKGKKWVVCITIGTGIGSGIILDGHIMHNPYLLLGTQLGHIIMDKSCGLRCITGNQGTGETLCSANALALQVRGALQRGIPSVLTKEYYQNPLDIDFKKVIEAVREGDKLCCKELDKWIENLSVLLVNAVHCYSPERIILSGGATISADIFLPKVEKKVNEQIFRYPKDDTVEIVISEFQEFAGVRGAGAYLLKKINVL
jgi:glucokinase